MDWGLLQGIGEGLTSVGKSLLAEQLEIEREKRAKEREIEKENRQAEREATTVASYKPEIDNNGQVWMRAYNAAGDPLDKRRPASVTEIEDFQHQRETNRLSLEALVADTATKKFKAGRLETEAAQDDEMFGVRKRQLESSIAANLARANASGRSRDKDTDKNEGPVPLSDLAESMVSEYSDMFEQYGLTHSDRIEVARAAINTARREGKDPVDVARRALPAFARWRKEKKKNSTGNSPINNKGQ